MTDDIDALAAEYWDAEMAAEPVWAHMLGRYPDRGGYRDATRDAEDRRITKLRSFADRAEAIPADAVAGQARLTREVLITMARDQADFLETRLGDLDTSPIFGVQVSTPIELGMLTLPDATVADAMAGTLQGIGKYYADLADRHAAAADQGRTPPRFAVDGVIAQLDEALGTDPADDRLVTAMHPPGSVDADSWRARMARVVADHVRPGMAAYRAVLSEILDRARPDDQVGLAHLPEGEEVYQRTLRYHTSTDLTADEIHAIGLRQVASLAEEYRTLGAEVLGTDDLATIFSRLRDDPALHFETAEEIVQQSEVALARAESVLADWFEVVPSSGCEVQSTTTGGLAFYYPPADDGSRGGTFFINVKEPSAWGRFELEAMAFHEGVPGHHLQLAVAAELTDALPDFRRHSGNSGYAEGWGLYSERLSHEMGLYSSPLDRMGMLSADSLRATRLVVDTGMHALGWSRQQANDYMTAHSPIAPAQVRSEVDRYISYPGQATSYMIGRLEIQRLRREAEERQGARFDIKRFHSAVLDSGILPLDVLDRVVTERLT